MNSTKPEKMLKISVIAKLVLLLILGQVVFPQASYAYLDPGTGSYLIQILGASLFAGLYMVKRFWTDIKNFFALLFSRSKKEKSKDKSHEDK